MSLLYHTNNLEQLFKLFVVTSPNKLPIGILGPILLSFYITKKGGQSKEKLRKNNIKNIRRKIYFKKLTIEPCPGTSYKLPTKR